MNRLYKFYEELTRRNVIKAAVSYLVVSWVLLQVVALIGDILNAPQWLGKALLVTLIILLPIWLVLSWYYELTPEGLKKTKNVTKEKSIAKQTSVKLTQFIIAFLVLAVILLFVDRFRLQSNQTKALPGLAITAPHKNSIVVLPFRDLSPQKDHEYFADGLAEELLNSLTKVPQLKVTSRTSAFSFKNQTIDIPTIAEKLGVNYILEGSVRASDSLIRVTIKLIDTKQDKSIWSQSWDRKMINIFEVQNSIATAVASSMEVSLTEAPIPKMVETDPKVYLLYLQANQAFYESGRENLLRAETYLNQALSMDNKYVPAKLLLAKIYQIQGDYGIAGYDEGNQKAVIIVEEVLKEHPNHAFANALRGDLYLAYDWDFNKAKQYSDKAMQLDPGNAEIIDYAATLALSLGHLKRAIDLQEYSVSLDPINPKAHYGLSTSYLYADQLDAAERSILKALELHATAWAFNYHYSKVLLFNGKPKAALKALEKETDDGWQFNMKALIYHTIGEHEKSDENLNKIIEKYKVDMGYQIAQIYAYRNEADKAFEWLENAYAVHDLGLNEMLADPEFRNLHDDPRWKPFLEKMGFSPSK